MRGSLPIQEVRQLRVVVFQEGDQWVAQCLDHDIGAQAPDLEELQRRIIGALAAELKETLERFGRPFANIDPAPARFQEMWLQRALRVNPVDPRPPEQLRFEMALCA